MKVWILCCFVAFCAVASDAGDLQPIELIADPPFSAGINQGFSRKPRSPFYNHAKRMVVIESIGDTVPHKKSGNNRVFHMVQFEIGEGGKSLKKTSRCVFEGSSRIVNEVTEFYPSIAPYVFRTEQGDGEVTIYLVEMNLNDMLERFIILFYDKDNQLISTQLIYQREAQ